MSTDFDDILGVLANVEGPGGPEGWDYVRLMERIAEECTRRRDVYRERLQSERHLIDRFGGMDPAASTSVTLATGAVFVVVYRHRHGEDYFAHMSRESARRHAAITCVEYAGECSPEVRAQILALDEDPDTDDQILEIYNGDRAGDESIEIEELAVQP